jgi:hypothetical protein
VGAADPAREGASSTPSSRCSMRTGSPCASRSRCRWVRDSCSSPVRRRWCWK